MPQPKIIYQDIAPDAKRVGTFTSDNVEQYCDLDDLKYDSITVPDFTSFEHNMWSLAGNDNLFPADTTKYMWGYVSNYISDANCDFETYPELIITFTALQSVVALTIDFDMINNEYSDVELLYYNDDVLVQDFTFNVNSPRYLCLGQAEYFNKIVIKFLKTSLPYRRARLNCIYFGIIREFDVDELRSISALEELNPISAELSINTMEFEVKNTSDIPFLFQKMQPLSSYYGNDLIGEFYINESERTGTNNYKIQCIDTIGLLDNYTFLGGMYKDKNVGDLLTEILEPTYREYNIDDVIKEKTVSGYLPVCTVREALMQIAFACGAVIDTSRSSSVNIYVLDDTLVYTYTEDDVKTGGSVKIDSKLTSVEVTSYSYDITSETEEIANSEMAAGEYTIRCKSPYSSYSITGGTITDSDVNYITFTVSESTNVIITGTKYAENKIVYSKKNPNVKTYDPENVKSVTNCTLITKNNVAEVLERVYNYYMRTETISSKTILYGAKVGNTVKIPTAYGDTVQGTIISNNMSFGNKLRGDIKVVVS